VEFKPQIETAIEPTHIVVATPGRLIDLIQRKAINLKETITILDED
jgi:ATP-dependent RNA helicase DeaD